LRTQVAIIGAGSAGMFLARSLRAEGIDAAFVERRDRDDVEGRVRAGTAGLEYIKGSTAAQKTSAKNYVGLPLEAA
jgi:monoamine oxidase